MKFGAVLQACRERAGLTQEEMADLLHRTQACVSKFENDHKLPDINTLIRWTDVTNAREVLVTFIYGFDGVSILTRILPFLGI